MEIYYWLVVWNIFYFFHILGIIIPTDFHIFQRGRYTTNQKYIILKYHSMNMLEGWTRINFIYFEVNPRVITRVRWYPALEVIPCDLVVTPESPMKNHGISPYGYGSIPMKIPFLVGWTSIYQLFWCEQKGYKVLTHCHITKREMILRRIHLVGDLEHEFYFSHHVGNFIIPTDELICFRGAGIPTSHGMMNINLIICDISWHQPYKHHFCSVKKWTQMDPQGLASELCVLVYELTWTN